MSKILKRLNDNQNKVADTNGIMKLQAWDYGVVQDLTNKQITATVANASGFLFDIDLVSNGTEIDLDFKDSQLQKLTPDTYFLEIKVTEADGDVSVFPTEGYATFTINKNLHATEGALVPQITFDTVLADVKTAMDKTVADYVKTIAKGDKGDTGPQGPQGIQGKQGIQGPKGDKGDKGDTPDITVGGRNLLLGTADWSGGSSRWNKRSTVTDSSGTYRGMTIASASGAWKSPVYLIQNAGILQVGKTYTFSTYVRNTSDTDTEVSAYYDDAIAQPRPISQTLPAHTDWTRISRTFKVIKDPTTSTQGIRWESQKEVTNGQIQFAGYKLEEGNIATDWTPAPEDVDSATAKAQATADNASTDIQALEDHAIRDNVSGQSVQGDFTVGHIMEADWLYKHVPSAGGTPFLEMDDTNLGIKQALGHYYSAFTHGSGVTLGAGGLTIVGGGESAKGLGDAINDGLADTSASGLPIPDMGSENTVITSDQYIYFMPGQQAGYPTLRPAFRFSSNGYLDKYTGSGWTPLIDKNSHLLAQDSQVVHNTGNETIAGNKTFSGNTTIGGTLMTDSGWKTIPLLSGMSAGVHRYRILNGVVYVQVGQVKGAVDGGDMLTLPTEARPDVDLFFPWKTGDKSGNLHVWAKTGKISVASGNSTDKTVTYSMVTSYPADN